MAVTLIDGYTAKELRVAFKMRLAEWGIIKDESYTASLSGSSKSSQYMMKLFGWVEKYGSDYDEASKTETIKPEVYKQLLLLNGVNGYCILKMMEARMK